LSSLGGFGLQYFNKLIDFLETRLQSTDRKERIRGRGERKEPANLTIILDMSIKSSPRSCFDQLYSESEMIGRRKKDHMTDLHPKVPQEMVQAPSPQLHLLLLKLQL
jgi:hypothetical protein